MQIDLMFPPEIRLLFSATLQRLADERVVARLWAHDASVWHPSAATQARIAERLGWLDLPDVAVDSTLRQWLAQPSVARDALFIAPGAAQSSIRLWCDLGSSPSDRRLVLLDTIEPTAVQVLLADLDWSRTALVLAATERTPELDALAALAIGARPAGAGPLTLITPPDSALAQRYGSPQEQSQLLDVPADLAERFGALSALGLAAAGLAGHDLDLLRSAARRMRESCQHADLDLNPAARLGALLGALAQQGRDKLTLLAHPALAPLTDWIASFVAASLGKHARGFVPISGEPWIAPSTYRADRCFVALRLAGSPDAALDQQIAALREVGQPIMVLTLPDRAAVAALVFCWQVAVAVAASIIGVNPFDEPDTVAMRDYIQRRLGDGPPPSGPAHDSVVEAARTTLSLLHRASWVALVSYLPPTHDHEIALAALRELLLTRAGLATVVVQPLRDHAYSVQLLHAGRPDGVVLALTTEPPSTPTIRELGWSLQQLCHTRMAVELAAWQRMQRAFVAVKLDRGDAADVRAYTAALERWL